MMTYQLKIDEMLEAFADLKGFDNPDFIAHKQLIEAAATRLADDLAKRLGVNNGPATFEGLGFAGTCAPFWPKSAEQPCPEVIAEYDAPVEDNWYDCDTLPTSPI